MDIRGFLNPLKRKWWKKDEWHVVDESIIGYEVVETYECPAWDAKRYVLSKYRNKNTCEIRYRKRKKPLKNPRTKTVWSEQTLEKLNIIGEDIEVYDGGRYE